MKKILSVLMICLLLLTGGISAENSTLTVGLQDVVTVGSVVTEMTHAGDERLFIVEQDGIIHVYEGGQLRAEPFLDISDEVADCNECGLLGLAFHPDYATNGHFYVNYVAYSPTRTVIERFGVDSADFSRADKSSRQLVLEVAQDFGNHNSGPIRFGPDGYLYISLGDGGSSGDPNDRAQDGGQLLGKMLRINVTGTTSYTIPADNPFVEDGSVRDEVWAIGLRNPYRFDFDADTGAMWLADVGQNAFEEVNYQPASSRGGENYGWDCYEANAPYFNDAEACDTIDTSTLTFPVFDYPHSGSTPVKGCSITGGAVYRGDFYPEFDGHYFFADLCTGDLWTLNGDPLNPTFNTTTASVNAPTAFGSGANGEMYVGDSSGNVRQITNGTPLAVGLEAQGSESVMLWWLLGVIPLAYATRRVLKARRL